MGDSVTVGIRRGFAFATGFPVTLCSTFSREMVSDVPVTYLSIPFTIRTQETVLSRIRDEGRPSHPRPGRAFFRVSEKPQKIPMKHRLLHSNCPTLPPPFNTTDQKGREQNMQLLLGLFFLSRTHTNFRCATVLGRSMLVASMHLTLL